MLLTKSKKQKELEAEIISLQYIKKNSGQKETINEIESLFELKQKGVLTEDEFIIAKRKILD